MIPAARLQAAIARGGDHLIQYLDGGLKPCGGDHPPVG